MQSAAEFQRSNIQCDKRDLGLFSSYAVVLTRKWLGLVLHHNGRMIGTLDAKWSRRGSESPCPRSADLPLPS